MVWWLASFVAWWGAFSIAEGGDDSILSETHAWARFGKGAWREVRIITENFDENGKIGNTSVTLNKTTVDEVTPDRVTLKVENTLEVAGQRMASPPQIVKQGFAGEQVGQTVAIKKVEGVPVLIDGQEVPCETRQIEILGGATKEVNLISYSPTMRPSILKRRNTTSDVATSNVTQESTSDVVALDLPLRVLDEIKTAYLVRQVHRSDRSTTATWSFQADDVPGEVVSQSSKKLDAKGKVVRRSTLELLGYGEGSADSSQDALRGRSRRHKRAR
jgi:hypothetical protein